MIIDISCEFLYSYHKVKKKVWEGIFVNCFSGIASEGMVAAVSVSIIIFAVLLWDFVCYRIPDFLCALLLAVSCVANRNCLVYCLISMFLVAFIFYCVHIFRGGMGFGDVKYAACLSFCFGLFDFLFLALFSTALAIIFSLAKLFLTGSSKIPYGSFLSLGALAVVAFRRFIL